MEVVCKQTYLDMKRIGRGTVAEVIVTGSTTVLKIREPAPDTEMHAGERLDVTRADFLRLWEKRPVPFSLPV
jgi:hypothetical protein